MSVVTYRERLMVPTAWWLVAPGLGLVVVVAFIVTSLPVVVVVGGGALVAVLVAYGLYRYGASITVSDAGLKAGRAALPWWASGDIEPLEGPGVRRAFGSEVDARAYLLLRSYCRGAVKVEVDDPADPTPYWLISTRRPAALARACREARSAAAN